MDPSQRPMDFLSELKRRRVVRVGIGYAAAVFVVLQAADLIFEALDVGPGVFRWLVIGCLAGFPVALILGWLFDVTPDGIRLTASRGEPGRLLARVPRWAVFAPVAVLLLSAVAFAVAVRAPGTSGALKPGAEVLAVMPFNVIGSAGLTSEGFVDLLSRNLDGVGGIRTVDPRTVLYRWEQRSEESALNPDSTAVEIGRSVRAGAVLTGSVSVLNREVVISAEVLPVDGDSTQLASVEVRGSVDHVLDLVDTLSVALVRELWGTSSARALPRIDVRAITSGNLDAIRAFLRGEEHYRASAWDSAMVWFARAVAADSIFPLAHYRLAMTAGWRGGNPSLSASAASTRLALHFSDRLPQREQILVRIMAMRADGDVEMAHDTLRAYLQNYPGDAEAWFLLADDEYHASHESLAPLRHRPEEMLVLFDRVFGLDPSFTPALIHPLEIAFRSGDAALIQQYVSRVLAVAPGSSGALLYADAADALQTKDPGALGNLLARIVATADSAGADLGMQAAQAVGGPVLAAVITLSPDDRAVALEVFRATLDGTHRDAAAAMLAHIEIAHGNITAARTLLAPLARDPVTAPTHVLPLERLGIYAGVADTASLRGSLVEIEPSQVDALRLVAAIDQRDAAAVQRAAQRIATAATDSVWRRIAEAGYGFAAALGSDTIAGLAQVQATLPRQRYSAGSAFDALWFRWVELLAEQPQTRDRAIELLLTRWPGAPALELQRLYVLGRALEAKNDYGNARIAFTHFITAAGDPAGLNGPMRARAEYARDALARFGSQRPSTTG